MVGAFSLLFPLSDVRPLSDWSSLSVEAKDMMREGGEVSSKLGWVEGVASVSGPNEGRDDGVEGLNDMYDEQFVMVVD